MPDTYSNASKQSQFLNITSKSYLQNALQALKQALTGCGPVVFCHNGKRIGIIILVIILTKKTAILFKICFLEILFLITTLFRLSTMNTQVIRIEDSTLPIISVNMQVDIQTLINRI